MNIKDKAAAYDRIVSMLLNEAEENTTIMRKIGTLNRKQGIKGFKTVEVGDPVFELGDRYILVMETLDGKSSAEISYYKEDLGKIIDFDKKTR